MNEDHYLKLLKNVLTDYNHVDHVDYVNNFRDSKGFFNTIVSFLNQRLNSKDIAITRIKRYNPEDRIVGRDWPKRAETMIGIKRLENIEECANEIIKNAIEGDFIEAGVWRGGAVIFMKALLKHNGVFDKVVWVADSFKGLPKPNHIKYEADKGDQHHEFSELKISLDSVKRNFERYDLLDDNVKFLQGWFKDTLPEAPIDKLSLIRLDGDMYESTMDSIQSLYPKLSVGGFIIIDDYGALEGCRKAVDDYRRQHLITEDIKSVDWTGVYWRKDKELPTS